MGNNNKQNNNKGGGKDNVDIQIIILKGNDLATLIKNKAEEYARGISELNKDKYTQIRKFYDELVKIDQQVVHLKDSEFTKYLPSIYIIASKSSYAKARKVLSHPFGDFIERNVKNIATKEDLKNFVLLFESILGYIKYFESQKNSK